MMSAAPRFNAWLDEFFAAYFGQHPVNATFIGEHAYDDLLPDLSEHGIGAMLDETVRLRTSLDALPVESLSEPEALDRRLAEGFLEIQRWELASPFTLRNPTLVTGEAIFGVIGILLRPGSSFEERRRAAGSRIEAVPRLLDSAARRLNEAPQAWIERARRECTGAQLLFADLNAPAAVAAFARFDAFLEREVRPTQDYACGSEAFELLLRYGHCLDSSAVELEQHALECLAEADGNGSLPTAEDDAAAPNLTRFQSKWASARHMADAFVSFPDWPVRYAEQPAWVRRAAPYLYFLPYRSPPPLGLPESVDYYVPPSAVDDAAITLNHVVHHGSLGHHVQNWYAARATSRIGRIAAVDCASRIAMLCGGTMAEGWACYSTDLAAEAGFLTPAERRMQRQTRRRMAARTIVDIRLHHGRFSLAEATAFYVEHVGMTQAAARAEAVKNSLFPATACMYLAGWEAIRRLRRELAARQSDSFSPRQFHDEFLSYGSVPVSLVAQSMLQRCPAVVHR